MTRAGVTQNRTFTYSGSDLASETTPEAGTVTYTYYQDLQGQYAWDTCRASPGIRAA
jgi:hypothetical protein